MRFERFMVTGGAGFIGSHLVERLSNLGTEVTVVDAFTTDYDPRFKRANVAAFAGRPGCRVIEADLRNPGAMEAAVADVRPQVIVHLAARAGVRPSLDDPQGYIDSNVSGTLNLLTAARTHGVEKFVFASSSSVYGFNDKVPFAESDPLSGPASPYGATKLAGEGLCSAFAHAYGLSAVSLRFFTVYGPRQRPDLAIRKFAERMLANRPITLFGDGTSSRDYTYVDDIIDGCMRAIELDRPGHDVFNLGSSDPIELRELVAALEQVIGRPATIEWLPFQPGDVPRTFADVSKSQRVLGYAPSTKLRAGLATMLEWMRASNIPG